MSKRTGREYEDWLNLPDRNGETLTHEKATKLIRDTFIRYMVNVDVRMGSKRAKRIFDGWLERIKLEGREK